MKRFDRMRRDCSRGVTKIDKQDGVTEVCGLNRDRKCTSEQCPSLNYWGPDRQIGWHEERALDRTGLVEQYAEEISQEAV